MYVAGTSRREAVYSDEGTLMPIVVYGYLQQCEEAVSVVVHVYYRLTHGSIIHPRLTYSRVAPYEKKTL